MRQPTWAISPDCSTLGHRRRFPTSIPKSSFHALAARGPVPLAQETQTAADQRTYVNWRVAAEAAESKKASNLVVLDLRPVTSFTDFFVICSVMNSRQGQAIADEIEKQLREHGERPVSIEGYDAAEWILMDYGDFLVHIFSESARAYYDLERLWRHAEVVPINS